MSAQLRPDFPEYAGRLIRYKTRQLIGKFGFTRSDRQDLEQELTAHVVEQLPRFDSRRACQHTFISRLVDRKIASIIRHRTAAMRDPRREAASLDEIATAECGKPTDLSETLTPDADRRVDRAGGDRDLARVDLTTDMSATIRSLDSAGSTICSQLGDMSLAAIARELDISPVTVRRQIATIRRKFRDAGLDEYLKD